MCGVAEEEEEECSDSETVESLGELSVVDLPGDMSKDTTPTCETKGDKKLLMLAQQFMAARAVQEKKPDAADKPIKPMPRKVATPDPAKLPQKQQNPSNPHLLPDFAS